MRFLIVALGLALTLTGQSVDSSTIQPRPLTLDSALFKGSFEIGEAASGLFSAVPAESLVETLVEKYLASAKDETNVARLFGEFKKQFSKSYKNEEHEAVSKVLFTERLLMVLENNVRAQYGQSSYILALRPHSDLPLEEALKNQTVGNWPQGKKFFETALSDAKRIDAGEEVDTEYVDSWVKDFRSDHMVTDIVNQGGCGSCVYFAAAACIESFWARKGHPLEHLSTQQLIDCAHGNGNDGCKSGTFVPTFNYIKQHGMVSWANWPYLARDASCDAQKVAHPTARISAWHPVEPHGDEMALERAIEKYGPSAVAVHVSDGFSHYSSGIFEGECKGGRNHAVLAIGYGWDDASKKDYWILKNQWGPGWGEHGYIRLRRKFGNMCDVAGDAVIVE